MIFKFLVSVTHSFILRGWTIFQVLMDTFIKKIENGTVLPIIPPSSGIRKENKTRMYTFILIKCLEMLKLCLFISTKTPTNPYVGRKLFICIRKKQFAF